MYTLQEIRNALPEEKIRSDGIWTRLVLRPLSILVSVPVLALGLSANAVSYLSAIFSVSGGVLFSLPGFYLPLTGALALNFFSVMDCVDGNVARVTRTASPKGSWADAVMGFAAYTAVFLSTGVYAFLRTGWWPYLVITSLTSSANLLTRVSYQKYKTIPGTGSGTPVSVSFEQKLADTVGVTGLMMPCLIVFHCTGFTRGIEGLIWFNLAFYLCGCVFSIIKLARTRGA